ncbi:MAG: class I SAM-dependent RNA methyltransferase [Streptosporangiaceae bacterium]
MNYRTGDIVKVTPENVAHGGWCVARPDDGPVVFVRHTLPGETVLARITEVTSRLARADAVEILTPSPDRVPAPCPYARPGACGGCDWQHVALPAQRALKATVIREQLSRLAGLDREVAVEALKGDEEPAGEGPADEGSADKGLGWRTRVQFAVTEDGVAGLRAHRSHQVIGIDQCLIAHPAVTGLGLTTRRWPGTDSLEAVVAPRTGERAVIMSMRPRGRSSEPAVSSGSTADLPPADSVLRRQGPRLTPLRGRPYLTQHAAGRDWQVSATAFWQVHPDAAEVLTQAVLHALAPQPGDVALDLYCGAGLFAGALAPAVGPDGNVAGIEADSAAVHDARHNLRPWPWARVHKGDVASVLSRKMQGRKALGQGRERDVLQQARLIVADPPRAGLARAVIDFLSAPGSSAARFAYVSCDPATLARDIGLLRARGWTLEGLRGFDAFPMTHHVECVATLTRPRPA